MRKPTVAAGLCSEPAPLAGSGISLVRYGLHELQRGFEARCSSCSHLNSNGRNHA